MELAMFNIIKKEKSQALLELAILAMVLIFVIGMLVSVGIGYSRNQDLSMRAFRNALWVAINPFAREFFRNTSVQILEEKPKMDISDTLASRINVQEPYNNGASALWTDKVYYDYSIANFDKWQDELLGGDLRDKFKHLTITYLDLPAMEVVINGRLYHLPTNMYGTATHHILFDSISEKIRNILFDSFPEKIRKGMPVSLVFFAFEREDNAPLEKDDDLDPWDKAGIIGNFLVGQPTRAWHWVPKLSKSIEPGDTISVPNLDLSDLIDIVKGYNSGDLSELKLKKPELFERIFGIRTGPQYYVLSKTVVGADQATWEAVWKIILDYLQIDLGGVLDQIDIDILSKVFENAAFLLLLNNTTGAINVSQHSYDVLETEEKSFISAGTVELDEQTWNKYEVPSKDAFDRQGLAGGFTRETNLKDLLLETNHDKNINMDLGGENISLDSGTVNYWNLDTEDDIMHTLKLNTLGTFVFELNQQIQAIYAKAIEMIPGLDPEAENIFNNMVDEADVRNGSVSLRHNVKTHGYEGWVTDDPEGL